MYEQFIVIGDIAGEYEALMRLLKKCPDYLPISVGDMVDRGPDSRKVLEFFMKNGKAVLGNHEHMMLDFGVFKHYAYNTWTDWNGGKNTLDNYLPSTGTAFMSCIEMREYIPLETLDWLSSLPLCMEIGDAFISHAPVHPDYTVEECCRLVNDYKYFFEIDSSIIWNRKMPEPMVGKYQIFGHNKYHCFLTNDDNKEYTEYGVCLDNSAKDMLVAMIYPSRETILEPY